MGLTLTNQNNAGSFGLTGTTGLFSATAPVAVGDQIRAALGSAYTASYDAATVGNFIIVDSASYLAVSSSVGATTYGMNQGVMNGPDGVGTSWGKNPPGLVTTTPLALDRCVSIQVRCLGTELIVGILP